MYLPEKLLASQNNGNQTDSRKNGISGALFMLDS
jgi:hypothetical protein